MQNRNCFIISILQGFHNLESLVLIWITLENILDKYVCHSHSLLFFFFLFFRLTHNFLKSFLSFNYEIITEGCAVVINTTEESFASFTQFSSDDILKSIVQHHNQNLDTIKSKYRTFASPQSSSVLPSYNYTQNPLTLNSSLCLTTASLYLPFISIISAFQKCVLNVL